jgi:uncharacterized UPF0160 family protein
MLHRTAEFAGAEVTRTRDPEKLAAMDIVVDVGAVYDPATHRYDHHQRDFTDTLDAEHTVTRLSSAGLIYKHFGREVLQAVAGIAPGEELELLYRSVYDNLIEEVDAVDNGVSNYPADVPPKFKVATMLGQRVARLNPAWNDKTTQPDAQFLKAMAMAGEEFESVVGLYARSVLPARRLVVDALAARHAVDASGQVPRDSPLRPRLPPRRLLRRKGDWQEPGCSEESWLGACGSAEQARGGVAGAGARDALPVEGAPLRPRGARRQAHPIRAAPSPACRRAAPRRPRR